MSSANWLLVNTLTDQKDLLLSGEWAGEKVNQISSFQPTKLKIWTAVKWDPFGENDCLLGEISAEACRTTDIPGKKRVTDHSNTPKIRAYTNLD